MKKTLAQVIMLSSTVLHCHTLVLCLLQCLISLQHYTMTKEQLDNLSPNQALHRLIEGNKRFLSGKTIDRNLLAQKKYTSKYGHILQHLSWAAWIRAESLR